MEEPVWYQADWHWNPIDMVAKPAESKMKGAKMGAREKSVASEYSDEQRLQKAGCQVDNCTADLGTMRDYHQRYKICEYHLKSPVVIKDGREQRFCQHCGKFQPREDFDGEKRSCRARLEKHNARRRRQREMQHLLKKGVKMDPSAVLQQYTMDEGELASKVVKLGTQGYKVHLAEPVIPTRSSTNMASDAERMLAEDSAFVNTPQAGARHPTPGGVLPMPPSMQPQEGSSSAKHPASGFPQGRQGVGASDRVPAGLDLEELTSDLGLLDDDFLDSVLGSSTLPTPKPPSGQSAPQLLEMDPSQLMDLDDMAILEEITNEYGSGLGFPPPPSQAVNHLAAPPQRAQQERMTGLGAGAPMLGAHHQPFPSLPFNAVPPAPLPSGAGTRAPSLGSFASQATRASAAGQDDSMTVIDEALDLLAYDAAQVTYIPEDRLFRFSAKLFNCTPEQLPSDLKASLINMLTCNSLEGYIRPGCVHVTVDALMGPEEREAMATQGVRSVVERLVAQQPEAFWAQHTMLVQLGDKMALVREGQVVHVLGTAASTQVFPRIAAVRPLVAAPEANGSSVEVTLWGYNLAGGEDGDVVLARSQGKYVEVQRVGEVATDPSWGAMQRMVLKVEGVAQGALQMEIMRGGFISSSKTLLVHADRHLAAEVCQLETDQTGMDIDTTLFEMGRVVEFASGQAAVAQWGAEERCKAGKAARRMLAFAVQRKWVCLTRVLLAGLAADCRPRDAVAAADVMAAGTTGMPLLQLAVRTQNKELVHTLLTWGRSQSYSFKATTPGRRGLTALHLAALIKDQGAIAGMITDMCDDALSGWETATAEDGTTPMSFAQAHGNAEAIRQVIAAKQLKEALASGELPRAMAAAGSPGALHSDSGMEKGSGSSGSSSPGGRAFQAGAVREDTAKALHNSCSPEAAQAALEEAARKLQDTPSSSGSMELPHDLHPLLDGMDAAAAMKERVLAADMAPAKGNGGCCGKVDNMGGQFSEELGDEIAREKAECRRRRRSTLMATSHTLSFRDAMLEAKYAKWYNSGQVPVDVAFIVIAVLSQGAWVFRWSMEHSLLGACMVVLMALNAALIQMACLFPSTYRRHRDLLCIFSHMVHKMVQLLVTVTPPVGTIYASTYNATVAVLESSSFAQVMMLSFGVKMRFAFHIFVNLFHLMLSAVVNGRVCDAAWPQLPGGLCLVGLFGFQLVACFLLPSGLVYLTERRSRRIFMDSLVD